MPMPTSHHHCLPNLVLVPTILPGSLSCPLMKSMLFPLLLGCFLSTVLLYILYHTVLCRLQGQFNSFLHYGIPMCCAMNVVMTNTSIHLLEGPWMKYRQ